MNTEDFLDILEQRELVPTTVLVGIREKVQKGDHRITPKSVLKFLVKKELVSRQQAKQLLDTTLTVTSNAESSILGFVPIPKTAPQSTSVSDDVFEEEIPTLAPVDSDAPQRVFEDSDTPTLKEEVAQEEIGSFIAESIPPVEAPSQSEPFAAAASIAKDADKKSKKKKKKKREKKNEWDSPLLLLGGGGLMVLLIVGAIVSYFLNRENADTVLAEADKFFDGGSYTQAINQYQRFVEKFPRHPQFSTAKVKLGMARLWKATSGTTQFDKALETAQQVLDQLEDEPDFKSGQRDLASLLPDIAEGLARQAEEAADPELVNLRLKQTETALALCENTRYIPKTFRDEVVLGAINETLDRVRRRLKQKTLLRQALVDIQAAIDAQDTAEAYRIHKKLLEDVPGLLNNKDLAAKVRAISAAEKQVVTYVAEPKSAASSRRPSKVLAELALAERRGQAATGVEGIVAVRVDGAVYGLNSADGALIWRKFVGFDPRATPVALPNGDFLVIDSTHHELLRLQASSGKLVWRLAFDGPICRPVVAAQRLLVVEQTGRLHVVESATGERRGYVQFGQSLHVPPTVGPEGRRIYVVGAHSSLFTLSAEDYSCLGVFYLGHAQGSISVPLVASLNKVVAAVNTGVETSQLHILSTNPDGVLEARIATRRQNGLLNTRLLIEGRRLVAATSRGQVSVYEVGAGEGEDALTTLASRDAERGPAIARFGLLHEGHVWTAGNQLSKLAILPTGSRLTMRNLDRDYLGDTFDHPLQAIGNLLIHVRRPAGKAGAIVAAMDMAAGRSLWEIELAVPPAGSPAVDRRGLRMAAATSSGAVYLLDREAMSRRVQDQAERLTEAVVSSPPLTESLDLGQGRLAITSIDSELLLYFRPDTPRGPLRAIPLPGPVSSAPVLWGNGFVVPTQVGQVFLFDRDSGQPLGTPFQPPLVPGAQYHWRTPATYGSAEQSRLVLCDGIDKIYLLALVEQPQPHLAAEVEAKIGPSPLNTRLAVLGDLVLAGTKSSQIAKFRLPSLEVQPPLELGAQITWGPFRVGDRVVLATDTEELVCLAARAEIAWRQPLVHGPPTGTPVASGDELLILWQHGGLSRLRFDDGAEAAHLPLNRPVVAGPVPFGKRLVMSSADGTLLVVDPP